MSDENVPYKNTVLPDQSVTDGQVRHVDVKKERLHQKLKNSRTYRHKFILTVFLWYTGMTCGWISGQVGPSLLDLQIITGTSFEMISKLLTAGSVGFLVGSILGGFLFSRVSSHLILSVSLFFSAVFTAVIPWCVIFEVMMAAIFVRQICLAVTDTVINAELLYIWRLENKSYMQALHFAFAFGGIMSPLATASFLTPNVKTSSQNHTNDYTLEGVTTTSGTAFKSLVRHSFVLNDENNSRLRPYITEKTNKTDVNTNSFVTKSTETCCVTTESDTSTSNNVSQLHSTTTNQIYTDEYTTVTDTNFMTMTTSQNISTDSKIFIAFAITASLALSCSLLYLILFLLLRSKKRNFENSTTEELKTRPMPRTTKVLILMIMLALIGVYNAIEESFAGFVTTYCVKQLDWSKTLGSIAASVFWATFGGGRFSGIFLIRLCSPARMIDIYGVFAIISFVGLLFSSLDNCDIAVWICIALIGISLSVFSPTIFTWTEEIIQVTGNIASGLKVAANAGSMVNSVILGILIDRYTPLWLCYLLLGECVFIFFLCIIATFYTRDIKAKRYLQETTVTPPNRVTQQIPHDYRRFLSKI